jgi:hypothetical protein
VTKQPQQQPFHEPVGLSPEEVRTTSIWIVSLSLAVVVLAAATLVWLRLSGRI